MPTTFNSHAIKLLLLSVCEVGHCVFIGATCRHSVMKINKWSEKRLSTG